MLDELEETSVALNTEQSSSPEGLLFSNRDEVAESKDEGMTTKKVCGEEDEVVPCSLPDRRMTENRAQCNTCKAWIHDGCYKLERGVGYHGHCRGRQGTHVRAGPCPIHQRYTLPPLV